MKLFVDMDGVLADFDTHYKNMFGYRPSKLRDDVDWKLVKSECDFFIGIPPMPDMEELWNFVKQFNPTVLTGVPLSVNAAQNDKRCWVAMYLGAAVPVICTESKKKYLYCTPGAILIDDWEKYKDLWVNAGGIWITHMSATESIRQIKLLEGI